MCYCLDALGIIRKVARYAQIRVRGWETERLRSPVRLCYMLLNVLLTHMYKNTYQHIVSGVVIYATSIIILLCQVVITILTIDFAHGLFTFIIIYCIYYSYFYLLFTFYQQFKHPYYPCTNIRVACLAIGKPGSRLKQCRLTLMEMVTIDWSQTTRKQSASRAHNSCIVAKILRMCIVSNKKHNYQYYDVFTSWFVYL